MINSKTLIAKSIGLHYNFLAYWHPSKVRKDGFVLFCTPFSKKIKAYHQNFLSTGLASKINVGSNEIQAYKWGNGSKKVLLVHGWASHTYRWKAYIETLVKNDFTAFAFDAPAHGNSGGKILNIGLYENAITEYLKINSGIDFIIAHSIGAFASTYYLFNNPENNIKNIVLLASPGRVQDFFDFWQQHLGLSKRAISIISSQFETELKHKIEYFVASNFAKNLAIPALIIHDKTDKATNPIDSEILSKNWKGSLLKLTDGLGHELKSEELLTEIISFLK